MPFPNPTLKSYKLDTFFFISLISTSSFQQLKNLDEEKSHNSELNSIHDNDSACKY